MRTYITEIYLDKNKKPIYEINEFENKEYAYQYDKDGRPLLDAMGTHKYDINGKEIFTAASLSYNDVYDTYPKNKKFRNNTYEYDKNGILRYERWNDGFYEYNYNEKGQLESKTQFDEIPDYDEDEDKKYKFLYSEIFRYDDKDRLISISDYDDSGEEPYEDFAYDDRDNIIYYYDHYNGNISYYEYDKNNKKIYEKFEDEDNKDKFEIHRYEYDNNGNIIKETIENKNGIGPEDLIVILYKYFYPYQL